jgi:hypothetical protein
MALQQKEQRLDFDAPTGIIRKAHDGLAVQAGTAVNLSRTLCNWFIGCYVAEYELSGEARAAYGNNLFHELANRLNGLHVNNTGRRQLCGHLISYHSYPEIVRALSAQ